MDTIEPQEEARPFILGVTGGIGSGKSTVCQIMESFGVPVFYSDNVARQIMSAHTEVIAEIIAAFGDESYGEDGRLNRPHIAGIVFNDDERLRQLNAIVHPRVREAFTEYVEAHNDERLVVHESAIIFESRMDDLFDAIVVVDAEVDHRVSRAVKDGKDEDDFRRRLSNQLPAEELRELADYIIVNNGTVDDLEDEVELLLDGLLFNSVTRG